MPRAGRERLDLRLRVALVHEMAVVERQSEPIGLTAQPPCLLRILRDRAEVRLDREADALGPRETGSPAELLHAAVERVVMTLARPVDPREHRHPGRLNPCGELEHVAEERPRPLTLLRVRVVRSEALEVRPRDAEEVGDLEPARRQPVCDPNRCGGNVASDVLGPDVRTVAHQADVDAVQLEQPDHLDRRLPRLDEPKRVVGAREANHACGTIPPATEGARRSRARTPSAPAISSLRRPPHARIRTRFSVGSTPGAHRRTGGPRSRASRHMSGFAQSDLDYLTFFTELVCERVDPAWLVAVRVQV